MVPGESSAFGRLIRTKSDRGLDAILDPRMVTKPYGRRFVDAVRLCRQATSLGGPETLVTHPASTTHAGMTDEEMAEAGITAGTIRISAGLEHADDVIADLAAALLA